MVFFNCHCSVTFNSKVIVSDEFNKCCNGKYMVMFRIHSVRTGNSTFERDEEFKYLGTNLTNQSSIPEEIKSR